MSRRRGHTFLAAAVCVALAAGAAACGEEETSHVVEGEPIELGDLRINVQLTRFLNPSDREDSEYLVGEQVPPPAGREYLAVFMSIENESSEPSELPSAEGFKVLDSTGEEFEPVEIESVFALPLGEEVPGHGSIPLPDTAARSGPIQGSIVLFGVSEEISENRPLELEIDASGEQGTVVLDI
jgi:hypothetical protein